MPLKLLMAKGFGFVQQALRKFSSRLNPIKKVGYVCPGFDAVLLSDDD